MMPCIYIPYSDETTLQVAHLVENELRAEMCFWDKACKYAEIRDIFQDESDSEKLSLRELEVMFSDKGLTVSHKTRTVFFALIIYRSFKITHSSFSHAKVEEIKDFTLPFMQFQINSVGRFFQIFMVRCAGTVA